MKNLDRARWLTDKYILVMLGVYPLFVGFHGYDALTVSKCWFFAVATGLWLLGTLALLGAAALRRESFRPALRPVHFAVTAFMLVAAFSALLSPWWKETLLGAKRFDGLLTLFFYGMIFLGVSLLARPRRLYLWVMAAAVDLCCVIAVLQLFGLDPFRLYPAGTNYYDKFIAYNSAFLGTIGNTGLLGQYLCITAPCLAVFALRSGTRREKLALGASALFALLVLAFSLAEAAYVGVLACVLVSVPMLLKTRRARRAAVGLALLLVLLGLLLAWFWPGESGTLWELSRVLHGDVRDEFGSHRVQIWRAALALVPERPLLGGGPGTFALRVDIRWTRYIEEINTLRTAVVGNVHNSYLSYLVNLGVLGLAAYLAAIACSAVTWTKRRFDGPFYGALGCSLVCCMAQDFFCLTLCLVTPLMWVLWGLLESEPPAEAPASEPVEPPAEDSLPAPADGAPPL